MKDKRIVPGREAECRRYYEMVTAADSMAAGATGATPGGTERTLEAPMVTPTHRIVTDSVQHVLRTGSK